jgi:hypothetical protein
MSVIVMAPVESHKSAVGISISLGKSNFVFILYRGGLVIVVGLPCLLATESI